MARIAIRKKLTKVKRHETIKMKYVIHKRHYEYNDSYYEREGKSVLSITDFESEKTSKKAWLELEKQCNDGIINLEIAPLLAYEADIEKFQYIIATLEKHGIEVKESIKEKLNDEFVSFSSMLGHSGAFQLTSLPDDVLLDVLLTCD